MADWLVALISVAVTFSLTLITTQLNARNAANALRAQLSSEESRHESRLRADRELARDARAEAAESRLFEHQRQSAADFLGALEQFSRQTAMELGALWALTQGQDGPSRAPRLAAAELERVARAAGMVSLYFPQGTAALASEAVWSEADWSRALAEHHVDRSASDPGPQPSRVAEAREAFLVRVQETLHIGRPRGPRRGL